MTMRRFAEGAEPLRASRKGRLDAIVDVAETPAELVMTAELPGLTPKDITVRVRTRAYVYARRKR